MEKREENTTAIHGPLVKQMLSQAKRKAGATVLLRGPADQQTVYLIEKGVAIGGGKLLVELPEELDTLGAQVLFVPAGESGEQDSPLDAAALLPSLPAVAPLPAVWLPQKDDLSLPLSAGPAVVIHEGYSSRSCLPQGSGEAVFIEGTPPYRVFTDEGCYQGWAPRFGYHAPGDARQLAGTVGALLAAGAEAKTAAVAGVYLHTISAGRPEVRLSAYGVQGLALPPEFFAGFEGE